VGVANDRDDQPCWHIHRHTHIGNPRGQRQGLDEVCGPAQVVSRKAGKVELPNASSLTYCRARLLDPLSDATAHRREPSSLGGGCNFRSLCIRLGGGRAPGRSPFQPGENIAYGDRLPGLDAYLDQDTIGGSLDLGADLLSFDFEQRLTFAHVVTGLLEPPDHGALNQGVGQPREDNVHAGHFPHCSINCLTRLRNRPASAPSTARWSTGRANQTWPLMGAPTRRAAVCPGLTDGMPSLDEPGP